MEKRTVEVEQILRERFSGNQIIALATVEDGKPYNRGVNAYYEEGSFYILTDANSTKMRQIRENPAVAISGDWFTALGDGFDLGYWASEENAGKAEKLRMAFKDWLTNGHIDLEDEDTRLLQVKLREGTLFDHGRRFDIDFT